MHRLYQLSSYENLSCTCGFYPTWNLACISFLDEDECLLSGACHDNATCTNIPGSFLCTCSTGFTGNQTYCKGNLVARREALPMLSCADA